MSDFFSECAQSGIPPQEVSEAWCPVCVNPQCNRAKKMRYNDRVTTWEKRLFTDVAKLDPRDPRYAAIASKGFITIDTKRTPSVSSTWVDPLQAQPEQETTQAEPIKPQVDAAPKIVVPQSVVIPPSALLRNPNQSGKILTGTQPQEKDAWATAPPPQHPVVARGARVRMGATVPVEKKSEPGEKSGV